jgi:hypothetical protein
MEKGSDSHPPSPDLTIISWGCVKTTHLHIAASLSYLKNSAYFQITYAKSESRKMAFCILAPCLLLHLKMKCIK